MSAFMLRGDEVWWCRRGADSATRPLNARRVVAGPARGQLTNDGDQPIIESLSGVASRSTVCAGAP